MAQEAKLDWIYKSANSLVDREDYLLGRKVDKTLEQLNEEEKTNKIVLPTPKNHVEHECIPPSIRDFNKIVQAEQVDLSAKLQEDPLVAIKKREEEARRQFLQNPIQLKKLQEALQKKEALKTKNKKSKKHSNLDEKIKQKLKTLKGGTLKFGGSKKEAKKDKQDALNTILMHKFNALKDKLSEDDLRDIINGKVSDESDNEEGGKPKKKKAKSTACSDDESESEKNQKKGQKIRSGSRDHFKKNSVSDRGPSDNEESRCRIPNQSRNKSSREEMRTHYRGRTRRRRSEEDNNRYCSPSRTMKNRKSKSPERTKRAKQRNSSSSEIDRKKKKVSTIKQSSSSDSSSEDSSDGALDKKIMAQLKILRGEVESTFKPERKMLPEKPRHLQQTSNSSSSEDDEKTRKYKYNDSEDEKPQKRSFGLVTSEGKKLTLSGNKTTAIKTVKKPEEVVKPDRRNVKRLTEDEKERLRREMMQNAKVRDKEREETVRRYREKNKEEEETVTKNFDADLVHAKLLKSAELASVEQRIKSNLNNIQRSSRHMDQNFSKR